MPSAVPTVSRRSVLVGTAALAVLGAAVACGSTTPVQEVDALVEVLERARADAASASAAAAAVVAARPKLAAALKAVANQRAAHAGALTDEIIRISGEAPPTSTPTTAGSASASGPSGTTTSAPPPPPPPSAAQVVAALEQSADGASLLAANQSGYRAGLLGSIAAACTALTAVTLADVGTAP